MKKRISIVITSVLMALLAFGGVAFAWPQYLDGRPSEFRPGHSRGFFIWRDNTGFNVRTTSNRHGHVFSGTIRTDGDLTEVRQLRVEQGDHVRVDRGRDIISFRFRTNANDTDGIDFRVRGGSRVHFTLFIDGHPVSPQEIHLGPGNQHPHSHSFTLHRQRR